MIPKFETKMAFVKWFFTEILLIFSNQPSFFSAKRIGRFIIVTNANIALDVSIYYLLKHDKIDYIGAVAIYSAQMIYAGYQTKQIFNEKPKAVITEETPTSTIEVTENK